MIVDAEHGTVDSPLHPSQVAILPSVRETLSRLTRAGYGLAIVSNQPAAAKGKTTRENLEKVNAKVLELAQAKGGHILSSHICYHRSEDQCACRKPRTGLLEEAFRLHKGFARESSWIVGDSESDIMAGQSFGLKTAMLADPKGEKADILKQNNVAPTLWAKDLEDFCNQLLINEREP